MLCPLRVHLGRALQQPETPRPSPRALRLRARLASAPGMIGTSRGPTLRMRMLLRLAPRRALPAAPGEWLHSTPSRAATALAPLAGPKPTPQASLLLNAGGMCTCPMTSCDLERSAFLQTPPAGPGVSDEELQQLGVHCTGAAALEGLAETSDVQTLPRACLYSGVRSVGSEERAGVRAQTQGRVLLQTVCAAGIGGTFQFGYNLSIINAPTVHIQEFTNQTWQARTGQPPPDHLILILWSLIVSLYPLGGLFGALLAGPLAVMLGRKKSLLVNNVFVVAAAVLFGFSHRAGSFEMIMLGRLLVGVSAGVSMSIQPMYLGESAPKEFRGAVAMTSAIFTALGIVMGQVVGLRELLGGRQSWPLLLASCLVPGVLQLASLPLLPESPRFLLIDRGDAEACLAALQRLRGAADLAAELAELEEERAACRGLRAWRPWELFQDRTLRRQVVSLVVLGSAMELCGNDSMYAYASSVFAEAGVPREKVQYAIIGTGCCELLTACISCMVIERAGRRVLLIGGYCLMTCWGSIFTAALCLQSAFPWMPYLAMSCIFAFILSFGIGPAGVTGILATELFDQMARPAAYMVCGALMWTMLFLVGLGFPFMMEGLSYFLYVPFLVVCVCGALYTGFFLPETKGKTFLEISEELHRLNFPRRSQGPAWRGPKVTQSTEL